MTSWTAPLLAAVSKLRAAKHPAEWVIGDRELREAIDAMPFWGDRVRNAAQVLLAHSDAYLFGLGDPTVPSEACVDEFVNTLSTIAEYMRGALERRERLAACGGRIVARTAIILRPQPKFAALADPGKTSTAYLALAIPPERDIRRALVHLSAHTILPHVLFSLGLERAVDPELAPGQLIELALEPTALLHVVDLVGAPPHHRPEPRETFEREPPIRVVDRRLVVLRPKQPCVDWINGVAHLWRAPPTFTLDAITEHLAAYLIREAGAAEDPAQAVAEQWPRLFELALASYTDARSAWPTPRSEAMFRAWFDVEISNEVLDSEAKEWV